MKACKIKTIKVEFGKYKHRLWDTEAKNFISEDLDRFALLEGKHCKTGTMYFCKTYLEACFVRALENGVALYSDEKGEPAYFVVVSKKRFR